MERLGLLLVMMEPPAERDEEFQAWYDTEHMPQRRGMPGFLSARRWECVAGWPRWLALYDLESVKALETEEYRAVAGERSTPWTRRVLGFVKGYRRVAAEQVAPGNEVAREDVARLVVARFGSVEEAEALRGAEGLAQLRVFTAADGVWVVAGFSGAVTVGPSAAATVWNEYVPYRPCVL